MAGQTRVKETKMKKKNRNTTKLASSVSAEDIRRLVAKLKEQDNN